MSYHLTDGIEFMKGLPDKSVDGIFSDPRWGNRLSKSSTGHRRPDLMIKGQSNWLELIKAMTDEGARVLKEDGRCLLWFGCRQAGPVIKTVEALEYRWMIFVRYMPIRYMASLQSFFDIIIYFARSEAAWPKLPASGLMRPQEYFNASSGKPDTAHPCARPYRCVKDILRDWFEPGEYVIDPFAGSDTTGFACRELDLRWESCEIDPKMYPTGLQRHRQMLLFENGGG